MTTTQARVQYLDTPPGLGHARAALAKMAELARDGAHSYQIRSLATRIAHGAPSKDRRAELAALYTWVRDHVRYRFDPLGLEWIQSPARTLAERAGDCDDLATLLAALAQSLGHRTRFATVGATRDRPHHVYAEAHDGAAWIPLDPVIEPARSDTTPRPGELGAFGQTAPGSRRLYSEAGQMLGFIPTQAQRDLWIFEPWESNTQALHAHTADLRYRSPSTTGGPRVVTTAPGAIDRRLTDSLGRIRYFEPTLGAWGFLKALVPIASALIPGVGPAVAVATGAAGLLTSAGGAGGKAPPVPIKTIEQYDAMVRTQLAKMPRIVRKSMAAKFRAQRAKVKAALLSAAAQQGAHVRAALDAAAKVDRSREPAPAQTTPTGFPLPRALPEPSSAAQLAPIVSQIADLARRSVAASSDLAAQAIAASARPKPPELRRAWDKQRRRWIEYRLAGLKPSFSIALLGAADPAMAASAQAAIARVRAFVARAGQPPQIALTEVRSFQLANNGTAASKLGADGLWGPNARAAAAYWTETPIGDLPPVATPYTRYAVSWQPPAAPAPAPVVVAPSPAPVVVAPRPVVVAPAPAPVVVAPRPVVVAPAPIRTSTPAPSLADRAHLAVRAVAIYRSSRGHSPTVAVSEVRSFQQAHGGLVTDGKYGPKTRDALAAVLHVAPSRLPPYAAAFAPRTPAPAPKPAPAPSRTSTPAPVVVAPRPVVGKLTLADRARLAVRAVAIYRSSRGHSPTVAVAEVRSFQQAHGGLVTDGKYGPKTREALAAVLHVAPSSLPPYAQAFAPRAPAPAPKPAPAVIDVQDEPEQRERRELAPAPAAKSDPTWIGLAALYWSSRRRRAA